MPRSTRRIRREMRSSSESPEVRHRRRIESSSPSPRRRRAITPPIRDASEERPKAHPQAVATPSLSIEDIREVFAAEVARAHAPDPQEGANSTARGRGRGRARGWGRGRWVNFGFYLPHPGPYTPFCRAHREAGCHICMYFCPTNAYTDPQEKGWSIQK